MVRWSWAGAFGVFFASAYAAAQSPSPSPAATQDASPAPPQASFPVEQPAAPPAKPAESSAPSDSPPSRARPAPPAKPPAAGTLHVAIHGDDGVESISVQGDGAPPEAGDCSKTCALDLPPGTYTLTFVAGGRTRSRTIAVSEPTEVAVSPGSAAGRGVGLALIISGGTVAVGAAALLYADASLRLQDRRFCSVDPTECYTSPEWIVPVGVGGGAIGLGTAVLGIVFFLAAQPGVSVAPAGIATASRPESALSRLHVTPELGRNVSGVRLDWSF